jgi:transcriptional regulator with XRE-family HTH domain
MKKSNFSKNFSDRFKKLLNGRSQTFVSKQLKCSQGVISKYLVGQVPDSFIFLSKLAEAYNADLHYLLTGEPSPKQQEEIRKYKEALSMLKVYVYEFLGNNYKRIEQLTQEKEALLSKGLDKVSATRRRIMEIDDEIDSIRASLKVQQEKLNIALEPVGKAMDFEVDIE